MIKVGITGGIGSGKTTVCNIFELLGVPVFYADTEAKKIMIESLEVKNRIIGIFGEKAYASETELNRKYIAEIVFKDVDKLEQLNAVVHPAVKNAFIIWSSAQITPYVLKEAALLFESKTHLDNDYNILVSSPLGVRIERVMRRDRVTKENVLERINKQLPEEEKVKLSDYVIHNDESQFLIKQVLALHQKIIEKAND